MGSLEQMVRSAVAKELGPVAKSHELQGHVTSRHFDQGVETLAKSADLVTLPKLHHIDYALKEMTTEIRHLPSLVQTMLQPLAKSTALEVLMATHQLQASLIPIAKEDRLQQILQPQDIEKLLAPLAKSSEIEALATSTGQQADIKQALTDFAGQRPSPPTISDIREFMKGELSQFAFRVALGSNMLDDISTQVWGMIEDVAASREVEEKDLRAFMALALRRVRVPASGLTERVQSAEAASHPIDQARLQATARSESTTISEGRPQ